MRVKVPLLFQLLLITTSGGTICPDGVTDVPDGYGATSYPNLFYKGNTSYVTYYDAYMSCLAAGGRLAMFKDDIQLTDLRAVRDTLVADAWTGLMKDSPITCTTYTACDGQLVWADGTTYQSAPLAPLSPTIYMDNAYDTIIFLININVVHNTAPLKEIIVVVRRNEFAIRLHSSYALYDRRGSALYNFICQFDCDDIVVPDTSCENGETPPDGFIKMNNRFYKFHSGLQKHHLARESCFSEGAKLPTFKTEDEYLGLRQMQGWMSTDVWMGLYNPNPIQMTCVNAADCSGKLEWGDAEDFVDPNPAWLISNGLQGLNGKHCFIMTSSGQVSDDQRCSGTKEYFCQFDCSSGAATPEPYPPVCPNNAAPVPNGYTERSGKYYKMVDILTNVSDAEAACEADGAYLATVRDVGDYEAIVSMTAFSRRLLHVGLKNPGGNVCPDAGTCDGLLQWENGITLVGADISYGVYAQADKECYFMTFTGSGDYALEPQLCTEEKAYLCQFDCLFVECSGSPPTLGPNMNSNNYTAGSYPQQTITRYSKKYRKNAM